MKILCTKMPRSSKYLIQTFCLVFIVLTSTVDSWGSSDKIKLREVETLTLYQGRMTTSQRSYPVPQLKCVGGSAGCNEFVPQVVQCQNKGYDGYDVQWECKTDMDNAYRFGKVEVVCEGYSYPTDPYILKGSCGLEYTLDFTKEGLNRGKQTGYNHNYYNSHSSQYQSYQPGYWENKRSSMGNLVALAIIALVIFAIYRTCIANNQYSPTSGDYPDPYGRQSGTFGSGSGTAPPPPPGFRQQYYANDSCGGTAGAPGTGSGTGGGGFWSGAATGGLLGYLFGSRGNTYGGGYDSGYGSGRSNYYSQRQPTPPPASGWSWGGSSPGSTGTRTASGYGGTRRR